jgi:hypothetical protein
LLDRSMAAESSPTPDAPVRHTIMWDIRTAP